VIAQPAGDAVVFVGFTHLVRRLFDHLQCVPDRDTNPAPFEHIDIVVVISERNDFFHPESVTRCQQMDGLLFGRLPVHNHRDGVFGQFQVEFFRQIRPVSCHLFQRVGFDDDLVRGQYAQFLKIGRRQIGNPAPDPVDVKIRIQPVVHFDRHMAVYPVREDAADQLVRVLDAASRDPSACFRDHRSVVKDPGIIPESGHRAVHRSDRSCGRHRKQNPLASEFAQDIEGVSGQCFVVPEERSVQIRHYHLWSCHPDPPRTWSPRQIVHWSPSIVVSFHLVPILP